MAESRNGVSEHNIRQEQDHASFDIRDVISSMNDKLKDASELSSECCIYRVHNRLRAVNRKAYEPHLVSIGPFHYRKKNLKSMEKMKWYYVKCFLQRHQSIRLENYVNVIKELEEQARKCYAETINLSSKDFVQMMIVDGCFMIELFLRAAEGRNANHPRQDPIFNTHWMRPTLERDLMLLENQLPFFILECLFSHQTRVPSQGSRTILTSLVAHFFGKMMLPREISNVRGKHLLDMSLNCILDSTNLEGRGKQHPIIRCANELKQAGIGFKVKVGADNSLDIKFNNGVIELPHLAVEDWTESFFRNLIAFEQCHIGCRTYVAAYAQFMDYLISSSKDVEVLCDSGILENWLGKDEDISVLFNKLGHEVGLDGFYYSKVYNDVNEYYETKWHKWKATLKRDYFDNPWTIISVVAAVVLLLLTITQTVFSIL